MSNNGCRVTDQKLEAIDNIAHQLRQRLATELAGSVQKDVCRFVKRWMGKQRDKRFWIADDLKAVLKPVPGSFELRPVVSGPFKQEHKHPSMTETARVLFCRLLFKLPEFAVSDVPDVHSQELQTLCKHYLMARGLEDGLYPDKICRHAELSPTEGKLLLYLLGHGSATFEEIIADVWDQKNIKDGNIQTHIKNIRRKLKRSGIAHIKIATARRTASLENSAPLR